MTKSDDPRIPVVFGAASLTGGDAVLAEASAIVADVGTIRQFDPGLLGHLAGCTCCSGRSPVATVLSDLFVARARGDVPYFSRVIAVTTSQAGRAAVLDALRSDRVAASRFRFCELAE